MARSFQTLSIAVRRALAGALALGVLHSAACETLDIVGPFPADAGPEADPTQEGGSEVSPCEACIRGQHDGSVGCVQELALCDATPKCGDLFRCTMDAGCWELKENERIRNCDLPCIIKAKITSLYDPAVKPFGDLADACAMIVCKDVCFYK
jgi:hypothetical protein